MVNMWKQKGLNLHQSAITSFINKLKLTNNVVSNADPYTLNSPFYLPPFDSLSPLPQPDRSPLFTPPTTSNPPSYPMSYGPPPPPSYSYSSPAIPPEHGISPPSMFPSPPQHQPSPPKHDPRSPNNAPGQPIYAPPMLNPPSTFAPPPKGSRSGGGVWCVAKPTVPDSITQVAMDYACGSGADCKSIQPNQPCFQPNTLISHASYAFNSYWQNTKGHGGTCNFGGTAMLVTVDPSFDKCQFSYK
ncbi:Pentatricopeptide repeat-containing-like protein [Hibiscus syriacus]|uniref:Pentatricopeptide repeat-containing-like protein n=1 Tax=Hibiscus syriacus TaxID=106335 RepID=A0A6A3BBR3_HIBSY|nr:proline-rich receptor-like protein kinase PERK13 [Hibiscus syriacus]KAE8713115.1 Pentatricopeptide repeat-containing-like protein [Hibiscus syriacus]